MNFHMGYTLWKDYLHLLFLETFQKGRHCPNAQKQFFFSMDPVTQI